MTQLFKHKVKYSIGFKNHTNDIIDHEKLTLKQCSEVITTFIPQAYNIKLIEVSNVFYNIN